MAKIIRTRTYKFVGQDRELTLKKWSGIKLLTLLGRLSDEFAAIAEEVAGVEGGLPIPVIVARFVGHLAQKPTLLVMLVRESLPPAKDGDALSDVDILEWDPEDLLGLVTASIELNFTDDLAKKAKPLLKLLK